MKLQTILISIILIALGCDFAPTEHSHEHSHEHEHQYQDVCVAFDTKANNTDDDDLFTCYTDMTSSECLAQNTGSSTQLTSPSGATWVWFADKTCEEFCEGTEIACNIDSKIE